MEIPADPLWSPYDEIEAEYQEMKKLLQDEEYEPDGEEL